MTEKFLISPPQLAYPYASKLRQWDERASVRAKPRRVLMTEEASGKLFFPSDLVPIAQHPTLVALGPAVVRDALVQHLYTYLEFTTKLEHDVVNVVAHRIAHKHVGAEFPADMVFDAYKLYCDEAYHALFSVDFKRQVAAATGIMPDAESTPAFLYQLRMIQDSVAPAMRDLVEVFFTIVSETLISATLSDIPRDQRVVTAVRDLVADHAEDEGRHHAYFSSVLQVLWPQLTAKQQETIGPLLPQFILGFLEPDLAAAQRRLAKYQLSPNDIDQVLHEAYPPAEVLMDIRKAASATLRLLDRTEVLKEPRTAEAFHKSGLIV